MGPGICWPGRLGMATDSDQETSIFPLEMLNRTSTAMKNTGPAVLSHCLLGTQCGQLQLKGVWGGIQTGVHRGTVPIWSPPPPGHHSAGAVSGFSFVFTEGSWWPNGGMSQSQFYDIQWERGPLQSWGLSLGLPHLHQGTDKKLLEEHTIRRQKLDFLKNPSC